MDFHPPEAGQKRARLYVTLLCWRDIRTPLAARFKVEEIGEKNRGEPCLTEHCLYFSQQILTRKGLLKVNVFFIGLAGP